MILQSTMTYKEFVKNMKELELEDDTLYRSKSWTESGMCDVLGTDRNYQNVHLSIEYQPLEYIGATLVWLSDAVVLLPYSKSVTPGGFEQFDEKGMHVLDNKREEDRLMLEAIEMSFKASLKNIEALSAYMDFK